MGIFRTDDGVVARLEREAELPELTDYLARFSALRLRLARRLGESELWLAYPGSESDMAARFGAACPVPVRLVTEGAAFDPIVARNVGGVWWFDEIDRRADPVPADHMRHAISASIMPWALAFPGLTPEMRTVYALAAQADPRFHAQMAAHGMPPSLPQTVRHRRMVSDEHRLRTALTTGGGALSQFSDRGDYWVVDWTTADGERHTSAIAKDELTVISSGICLSGEDNKFDLQSLVQVIQRRDTDW